LLFSLDPYPTSPSASTPGPPPSPGLSALSSRLPFPPPADPSLPPEPIPPAEPYPTEQQIKSARTSFEKGRIAALLEQWNDYTDKMNSWLAAMTSKGFRVPPISHIVPRHDLFATEQATAYWEEAKRRLGSLPLPSSPAQLSDMLKQFASLQRGYFKLQREQEREQARLERERKKQEREQAKLEREREREAQLQLKARKRELEQEYKDLWSGIKDQLRHQPFSPSPWQQFAAAGLDILSPGAGSILLKGMEAFWHIQEGNRVRQAEAEASRLQEEFLSRLQALTSPPTASPAQEPSQQPALPSGLQPPPVIFPPSPVSALHPQPSPPPGPIPSSSALSQTIPLPPPIPRLGMLPIAKGPPPSFQPLSTASRKESLVIPGTAVSSLSRHLESLPVSHLGSIPSAWQDGPREDKLEELREELEKIRSEMLEVAKSASNIAPRMLEWLDGKTPSQKDLAERMKELKEQLDEIRRASVQSSQQLQNSNMASLSMLNPNSQS
jgi:hypothetical protein